MGKEAYDDYKRHLRDREANSQRYLVLEHPTSQSTPEDAYLNTHANTRSVPSSSLRVGDLVLLEKNQRVPADLVLLRTSESSGTCFIRTDQLDGETDWKLRVAVPECQKLDDGDFVGLDAEIYGKLVVIILICAANSPLAQLIRLSRIFMPLSAHLRWINQRLQTFRILLFLSILCRPVFLRWQSRTCSGRTLFWLRVQLSVSWFTRVPRLVQWWTPVIRGRKWDFWTWRSID